MGKKLSFERLGIRQFIQKKYKRRGWHINIENRLMWKKSAENVAGKMIRSKDTASKE